MKDESSDSDQDVNQQQQMKQFIAYRHHEHKQQQMVFEAWKDQTLINYRSGMLTAISFHEKKLLMKGYDGLMEYVIASVGFKEKLILFYYRYILKKYFDAWRENGEGDVFDEVRNSLDSITKSGKQQELDAAMIREKQRLLRIADVIDKIVSVKRVELMRVGLRSIHLHEGNDDNSRNHNKPKDGKQVSQSAFEREAKSVSMHSNMSRNALGNSRRSAVTNLSTTQISRRKHQPILQQVELPKPLKQQQEKRINRIQPQLVSQQKIERIEKLSRDKREDRKNLIEALVAKSRIMQFLALSTGDLGEVEPMGRLREECRQNLIHLK